jgi:uncharacterized repeat protein (TIGR03803 family)
MCSGGGSGGVGTIFKITPAGAYSVLRHLIWTTDGSNPYGNLFQNTDGNLYGLCSGGGPTRKGVFFKITTGGAFTVLHGFVDTTEGSTPKGGLIKGTDGNLYGMTSELGKNFGGAAFKITTAGVCTVLASFDGGTQGHVPYENLVKGNDSAYYGTTGSGGKYDYGTVFKICGGTTTVLRSFNRPADGGTPKGSLVLASNGSFYGMTNEGGTFSYGTIFKITASGSFSVLHHFNVTADGSKPQGSLIQGKDGNLYGMTTGGGSNNSGTIFRMTLSGTFTVLHHFIAASEGSAPEGSLIQDTDSTFYGMTTNAARIFKMKPNGTFTVMRTLTTSTDGNFPGGSFVKGNDGNFYATTSVGGTNGVGTIFKISAGGTFNVLKHFNTTTDGKTPKGDLLLGNDGNFYGMTSAGGTNNAGTLFKITPAGAYTVLKQFDLVADGGTPFGGLIIAPVNNLVANAQNLTTTEDSPKAITLTGSGGSPLSYNIVTNPKHGKITGSGANRTYTPAINYAGTDQFSFNVSVGCVASTPAIVKITVTAINDTPVLAPIGNKTVVKNTLLTFTATATDPDAGQTLSFSLINAPAGAAINASTGVFTWTPAQTGSFTFKVRVTDNGSPILFDEEQITVTVTASLTDFSETAVSGMQKDAAIKIAVYPNPVKDKLTVTFTSLQGDVLIRIVDMNGTVTGTVNKPAGKNRYRNKCCTIKARHICIAVADREKCSGCKIC